MDQLRRGMSILALTASIEGLECAEGCGSLSCRMRERLLEEEDEKEEEKERDNGVVAAVSKV